MAKSAEIICYIAKNYFIWKSKEAKLKTAIIIRHVAYEGLGLFTRVLEHSGYDIIYFDAGVSDFRKEIALQADIVIVLGGPVSVNDIVKFPYLIDELQLVEKRLANDLPVFGIGLGAQMLAKALGESVYPMSEREYGWAPLRLLTEDGVLEPLRSRHVLHWHNDAFSLPSGATLLASTAKCEVQAFSWKKSMALQFHTEINMLKFEQWVLGHAVEIQQAESSCLNQLRQGVDNFGFTLEEHSSQMFYNWLLSLEQSP